MNKSPYYAISAMNTNLTKSEQAIAQFVQENYKDIGPMNISEVAQQLNLSETTIIRFTQKLGYQGFKDFKLACASDEIYYNRKDYFSEIHAEKNSFEYTLSSYILSNISNLETNIQQLDYQILEKVVNELMVPRNIYIAGAGYSGIIAKNLHSKLRTVLKNVHLVDSNFEAVQESYMLNKDDLIFGISQTGESALVKTLFDQAKISESTTVLLTAKVNSYLYDLATYPILSYSTFKSKGTRYYGNEILFTFIIQAIYIYLVSQLDKENYVFKHFSKVLNGESKPFN
ncbi:MULTISPECIES: MurR/RpiR family transcriptional regulator [Aerococcus]|uniref:MurR/RpiR family transcriptional regulator n=1 Tax=Aerococcus TaxID=1375 RepID=UPI000DCF617F|nr:MULTISPECIES: MurR/RpiR family transcriptional regulator [Aerococcus]KAA9299050.1 MurR/RpiR family transcriptional regulator [Aerococcus tenax]MDK6688215.1 MurR/RpiR family transcriptional regulator [Aerococcus urinae]MDK8132666.1 MurR/RpiR family transcriptional regulator [Aerococcus urinae]MDK8484414.1 MurR/RpiR family transcriptional regulator [Aerococcus urinae]MDL5179303.1 MurR/RpiR family transcriptional regulator [Aerococcus tenax]